MRAYFSAAISMLLCPPAYAVGVDGFDLPGSDYYGFNADSAFVCRNTCGADSRCQAWTWVKPGIQGPTGRCYLKGRLPDLVKNAGCVSGPRNYIEKRDLSAEDRIDRPGSDFRNFETDSWKNCEAACEGEQTCAAWTYARPGAHGLRGLCWLKTGVPHPVSNQNTISGVKFRPASVRLD